MAKRRIAASASRTVTLLDLFCRKHDITTAQLATMGNVSRQQTNAIRSGRSDTTITTAKMLAKGAALIVRRKVAVGELFDLDYHAEDL